MNTEKELSMRESQMAAFDVLLKIKEVFDAHNWIYYLAYGTLLGAIRHNGFIPWDDDIDIWVPRKDYEAFISYFKTHREEFQGFNLFHYSTCSDYFYPIVRFSDTKHHTRFMNRKDYGLGSFVDIYPLDGIDPDDVSYINKLKHKKQVIALGTFASFPKGKNIFKNVVKFPLYIFSKLTKQTKKLENIDFLGQKYKFETSNFFTCTIWEAEKVYCTSYLGTEEFHEFNNILFRIPHDYDKILKQEYGDYMRLPPENERIGHHYYQIFERGN